MSLLSRLTEGASSGVSLLDTSRLAKIVKGLRGKGR